MNCTVVNQRAKTMQNQPIPIFQASTAYKTVLSLQREDNNLDVLFVYIDGTGIVLENNSPRDLGIEKYMFANPEYCNDWYNLLHKILEYEIFLNREVSYNAQIAKATEPIIHAFNTQHNTKRSFQRFKSNIALRRIETRLIHMNAFQEYNFYRIKKDPKNLIDVDGCVPIFNTIATFSQNSPDIYIYEHLLIKSLCGGRDTYSKDSCIRISLFKDNSGDADKYFQDSIAKSKEFQKHSSYLELEKLNYSAIQRFEKYMHKAR